MLILNWTDIWLRWGYLLKTPVIPWTKLTAVIIIITSNHGCAGWPTAICVMSLSGVSSLRSTDRTLFSLSAAVVLSAGTKSAAWNCIVNIAGKKTRTEVLWGTRDANKVVLCPVGSGLIGRLRAFVIRFQLRLSAQNLFLIFSQELIRVWIRMKTSPDGDNEALCFVKKLTTYSSLEVKKGNGGNLFSPGVLHVKGGDDGLLLQVQQLTPPLPLQPLLVLSMLGRYIIQHNNIQAILHTTQLRTYFCI